MPRSRVLSIVLVSFAALLVAPATAWAALPACQHFYTGPIPDRPISGGHGDGTSFTAVQVSGRLPRRPDRWWTRRRREGDVHVQPGGRCEGVPRVQERSGAAVDQRLGSADLAGHGCEPVRRCALPGLCDVRGGHAAASMGQITTSVRLNSSNRLAAFALAPGPRPTGCRRQRRCSERRSATTPDYGICAVDARIIPWGTRLWVPGYGHCYAADIGSWIKDDIVDVWFPPARPPTTGVSSV